MCAHVCVRACACVHVCALKKGWAREKVSLLSIKAWARCCRNGSLRRTPLEFHNHPLLSARLGLTPAWRRRTREGPGWGGGLTILTQDIPPLSWEDSLNPLSSPRSRKQQQRRTVLSGVPMLAGWLAFIRSISLFCWLESSGCWALPRLLSHPTLHLQYCSCCRH